MGAAGTDMHSRHYWDNGAAKFMGIEGSTRTATVFDRADKRAANYGTLSGRAFHSSTSQLNLSRFCH